MTTAIRSFGFLIALAALRPMGAQNRPALQLTLHSAELAEGDALRVSIKAAGISGQRVVLVEGSTLLAAGDLNLLGEAELMVRNLTPGRHRIKARLPRRNDLGSDVVNVQVLGEQLPPASATDFWIASNGRQGRRHVQLVEGRVMVNQQQLDIKGALAAAALDADLDGNMDLMVATGEELLLLMAKSDGTYDPAVKLALRPESVSSITNLLPGDWNGSGRWDVILGTDAAIELWVAANDRGLERKLRETGYRQPLEADVNGDGLPDLLVERAAAGGKMEPWVWMGTGTGRFAAVKREPPESRAAVGEPQRSAGVGFTATSAGGDHGLALKSDGTVWAWGRNAEGEVGDGSTTNRLTPVKVSLLTGVVAVAGGATHSLALKNDGTVWGWGTNGSGQLGDGTMSTRLTPVQVSGLTGVVAIAAGFNLSLALKSDGTVWAWGFNYYGGLGDGTTIARLTPVQVSGLTGVAAIAVGYYHSMALKNDGTLWSWGYNSNGQLGVGNTTNSPLPIQVGGLTGVVAIACGSYHSLALKSGGAVWAWGWNLYGQIGDGTTTDRMAPVPASGLTGVVAIAGGYYHSLAAKSDGSGWAWGWNGFGGLGDGTTTNRATPGTVSGLAGVVAMAGGTYFGLALKSDGTVWAWGYNLFGELGDGSTTNRLTPVSVGSGSGLTISGQVTKGGGALAGVTVSVTSGTLSLLTTDGSGNYNISGLIAGNNWTVTPTLANYAFTPLSATFTNLQSNQTANFTGIAKQGAGISERVGTTYSGYSVLDANGNFAWDGPSTDKLISWSTFQASEKPIYGDWNGDGKIKVGVYNNGTWLLDYNGNGVWDGPTVDKAIFWSTGQSTDVPVLGDWNGDGKTKIGIYNNGTWILDYNGNGVWEGPAVDKTIYWSTGQAGEVPVVGDWNGDGKTKIGVHVNGTWILEYNGNFAWDGTGIDKLIFFGGAGYSPMVGDWNGSGWTKVGAYHVNGTWALDFNGNFTWDGTAIDRLTFFGGPGWVPVVGDWSGSGSTKIGAYTGGQWALDYNGNFGWDVPPDRLFSFGAPGQTPIVGKW